MKGERRNTKNANSLTSCELFKKYPSLLGFLKCGKESLSPSNSTRLRIAHGSSVDSGTSRFACGSLIGNGHEALRPSRFTSSDFISVFGPRATSRHG